MKMMATSHETMSAMATTAKRVKQYSPAPLLAKPTGRNPVTVTNVPVSMGNAKSGAGEYCFTLFAVVAIALIVSWLVAIIFIPYLGNFLLKERATHEAPHQEGPMTLLFRRKLIWALRRRRWVVGGTVLLFVFS